MSAVSLMALGHIAVPHGHQTSSALAAAAQQSVQSVWVIGGMMNQEDLDAARSMAPPHYSLVLFNSRANSTCDSTVTGVWCGRRCDELVLPYSTTCRDVPNMGRSEAAYFRYVTDLYDELAGQELVFSGSTITGEGREAQLRLLLTQTADSVPSCWVTHGELRSPINLEFTLMHASGPDKSYCHERTRVPTLLNGTRFEAGATPCSIRYVDEGSVRAQTVCAAEPGTLQEWLTQLAPSPGPAASAAPCCGRGIFRTTGELVRRRAKAEYAAVLAQLLQCSNPEAAHFIERAALYLFASL